MTELVTAVEAARAVHVSMATFRRWHIPPIGMAHGRAYYDLTQVRLCERDRYRTGKRRIRRAS